MTQRKRQTAAETENETKREQTLPSERGKETERQVKRRGKTNKRGKYRT